MTAERFSERIAMALDLPSGSTAGSRISGKVLSGKPVRNIETNGRDRMYV